MRERKKRSLGYDRNNCAAMRCCPWCCLLRRCAIVRCCLWCRPSRCHALLLVVLPVVPPCAAARGVACRAAVRCSRGVTRRAAVRCCLSCLFSHRCVLLPVVLSVCRTAMRCCPSCRPSFRCTPQQGAFQNQKSGAGVQFPGLHGVRQSWLLKHRGVQRGARGT